jgi:hypothetical protein
MRKELTKLLKTNFIEKLNEQLPQFEEDNNFQIPAGCKLFSQKVRKDLWFFLELVISPKDDCFTIQIGWSKKGLFPTKIGTYQSEIEEIGVNDNLIFRLSRLIDENLDYWWCLAKKRTLEDDFFTFKETPIEIAKQNIPPAIDEVFEQINQYIIPYFDKISRK